MLKKLHTVSLKQQFRIVTSGWIVNVTFSVMACVLFWCCRRWRQRLRQWQRLHRGLPHRHGRCFHRSPGGGSRPERACGWLCPAPCTLCSPANHSGPLSPGTPPTMEIMLEKPAKHGQQGFFFFFAVFVFRQIGATVKQTVFRVPAWRLEESALKKRAVMHHDFPLSQRSCSAILRLDILWHRFTI